MLAVSRQNKTGMKIFTKQEQILGDTYTPIGVFLNLRDHFANVSLFESSDYQNKNNAHSFIVANPIVTIEKYDQLVLRIEQEMPEFFEATASELNRLKNSFDFDERFAHQNGFFGAFSFESVQLFEDIKLNKTANDLPDIFLAAYEFVLIFDHFSNQITLLHNSFHANKNGLPQIIQLMRQQAHPDSFFETVGTPFSSETDESFKLKVDKVKAHVKRGDVFQLVLSRQFQQGFSGDDFQVYRALRTLNPSPYMFYFDLNRAKLIGASPEAQIKIENGKGEIHPIAGTVRRNGDSTKDEAGVQFLLNDPKENAEHIMLVDLARNDLNRHCQNVQVEKLREVQTFSHVIHLVSNVTGQLNTQNSLEVFGDCFPAGTLSGAPKYRAMELINEYESVPRNFYGGAIGLFAANGDVNTAIIIRSALSRNGNLTYQAGAGIVYDSTCESECQEVYNKTNSIHTAIKNASK